jgi:hypothetical protein
MGLDGYWQDLYYCTHTHTHTHKHTRQYLSFRRVACIQRVSCRNACRMGSSKSSFVTKSCPRSSAEFLAGFTFRSGDSMCTCIYCVFRIVSFMYIYSYSFCVYECKHYCHRVTTQLQLVIIIIIIITIISLIFLVVKRPGSKA